MFANLNIFEKHSENYIIVFSDFFVANMLALMMNEKGEAELLIYDFDWTTSEFY
jgi:chemotaxis protein CheY-P-specific phosphatase CheC